MIKEIGQAELQKALSLVNRVFAEFVAADYLEQGRQTFEKYLENKLAEISADLASGNKKMWAYLQNEEIVGVIASRNITHISLLFVDKRHHRKGIAKQLFNHYLNTLEKNEQAKQITVNSSPYAEKIYERLGFYVTGSRQEKDGIIFIPMAYDLQKTLLPNLDDNF